MFMLRRYSANNIKALSSFSAGQPSDSPFLLNYYNNYLYHFIHPDVLHFPWDLSERSKPFGRTSSTSFVIGHLKSSITYMFAVSHGIQGHKSVTADIKILSHGT